MTTHSDNRPTPTERISGVGDLIAAIPALMGFVPTRSLVLVCLRSRGDATPTIGTLMRHDLVLPEPDIAGGSTVRPEMSAVIEQFASVSAANGETDAMALIVDDRWDPTSIVPGRDRRFHAVALALTDALRTGGTAVTQVFVTPQITAGGRWRSLTGASEHGRLADPSLSPVALAHIVDGRIVHESRTAMERALDPSDSDLTAAVAACIGSARSADSGSADSGSDRVRIGDVLGQLETWSKACSDRPAVVNLTPLRAAQFGVALRSVMVRDSLLALALTDLAATAEHLWLFLMRALPSPERACSATLLAFYAYARGDGAMASVALDIALEADPDYSLAALLERSLLSGAAPDLIREVALSGYQVAELCGVRLPPPVD